MPVGCGYDSVAAVLGTIHRLEEETAGMGAEEGLRRRQTLIREVDEKGIIAAPANSSVNELARISHTPRA